MSMDMPAPRQAWVGGNDVPEGYLYLLLPLVASFYFIVKSCKLHNTMISSLGCKLAKSHLDVGTRGLLKGILCITAAT
jgi:hypothetical protein